MRNVCNISKTYTPCAHITNSSSSSLATQLGESLIQLAHMESCSAASRRIRPSPKRYGENEVETWSPPDCCTQSYEAAGIKVHKDLYPTAVSESKDQLCASVLSYFIFKSIQWFTVTTWIPDRYHIPCITLHVKTSRNQRNQHDLNQVAKTTGEEPSSEPSQMDLRTQNSGFSVVKRRVRRFTWFHYAFLVGGWTNPSEKYESKWESSPNRGENKTYLKPSPSFTSVS